MMQAQNLATTNIKSGVKPQVPTKLAGVQKADKTKPIEVVTPTKQPSFSLTLEAYSDCV